MDSAVKQQQQHGWQEWDKDSNDSDRWNSSDVGDQNPVQKNRDQCSSSWQHQPQQFAYDNTLLQWRQPSSPLVPQQHHHQLHLQRTLFGCWQHLHSCQHLQQYQHVQQNHQITDQHARHNNDLQLEQEDSYQLENKHCNALQWSDCEYNDREDLPCHPHPLHASSTPSQRFACQAYKRKCSSMWATDRQPDSDDEEDMPSFKRQRISVAAVQRLLSTLSIAGTSSTGQRKQQHVQQQSSIPFKRHATNYFKTETAKHDSNLDNKLWPKQDDINVDNSLLTSSGKERHRNSCRHKPNIHVDTTERNNATFTNLPYENGENDVTCKTNINCNFQKSDEVNPTQVDAPSENTDTQPNCKSSSETLLEHDKSQSTAEQEQCSDNTDTAGTSNNGNDHSDNISSKRNADEDVTGNQQSEGQHLNKKVRKLKRGLRLCTNITCYIEQVLYNC